MTQVRIEVLYGEACRLAFLYELPHMLDDVACMLRMQNRAFYRAVYRSLFILATLDAQQAAMQVIQRGTQGLAHLMRKRRGHFSHRRNA